MWHLVIPIFFWNLMGITVSNQCLNVINLLLNLKQSTFYGSGVFSAKDDVTIYNETGRESESTFSNSAQDPRQIIDWLPRILVFCALLHLIPRIYWEQNVGHILKSYLSYMANLIAIIKGLLYIWYLDARNPFNAFFRKMRKNTRECDMGRRFNSKSWYF